MGFGYGLGYVESEAVASGAAVSGRVNTVEAVEELRDVFLGHVFAAV